MTTLDAAAIELANSLSVEAVPAKLRCGSCNKLAVNAVKLPCCDQSICKPCSQDLPESCPICGHSPLSADDCKPNKSLRMTVKAFIKSEEKKRSKGVEATASETPAPVVEEPSADLVNGKEDALAAGGGAEPEAISNEVVESVEVSPVFQDSTVADPEEIDAEQQFEDDEDDEDDVVITTERPEEQDQPDRKNDEQQATEQSEQSLNQFQMNGEQDFGFGNSQQGFTNMDFNSMNFNPMMAMQGGMGMGNFPMGMLGMPGMNMDPSMMFGNGSGNGFGGMSMNDMNMMNMAMGMGGMGGFGGNMMGMNGPQSGFFPGQGGYNHPNFGSQMNQSFPNRGYGRPYGRGGYGRGRGGFGYNRGGRGGWQSHPHQFQDQQQYPNQQPHQQQSFAGSAENMNDNAHTSGRRASPSYEPMKSADGAVDNSNNVSRQPDTDVASDVTTNQIGDHVANAEQVKDGDVSGRLEIQNSQRETNEFHETTTDNRPDADDKTKKVDEQPESAGDRSGSIYNVGNDFHQHQQSQQNYAYSGPRGGGFGGRGGFRGGRGNAAYGYVATAVGESEPTPPAPPINAPTGPKAMRAGLPNSGIYSRPQPPPVQNLPVQSRVGTRPDSRRESVPDAEKTKQVDLESRERSKSRSRSRTRRTDRRSRDLSPRDKQHHDEASERHRDRDKGRSHRERDRRHLEDDDARADRSRTKDRSRSKASEERNANGREQHGDSHAARSRHRDRHRHRDRSRSPERNEGSDSSRRRNKGDRRRDEETGKYDRSRDRDRTRDRRDSSREASKRHDESHRSRDSSRRARNGSPRGDGRTRDRDRHRDRDSERSSKKPVLEQPEDDIGFKIKGGSRRQNADESMGPPPPTGPRRRDRGDRRSSTQEDATSTAPPGEPGDSYAAERQAREQARMERHRSQLAQTSRSNSLGKRTNREDEEVEIPTGPKGYSDSSSRRGKKARPMSYKYEDEIHDGRDDRDSRRWR